MKISDIPSMGGQAIGPDLVKYAKQVDDGVIVEIGAWLGAGTAYLALGARGKGTPVYSFDKFEARHSEVKKAKRAGWTIKGDTLPLVQQTLEKLGLSDNVILHKGLAGSEEWDLPIGLFVLDTCKGYDPFNQIMRTYSPYFIPGKTVLVFMDFWYSVLESSKPSHMNQKQWADERSGMLRPLIEKMSDKSSASFLYLGGDLC